MSTSLGIKLDPRADEPLYRQLFDEIVARIQSGTFPPRYRLPPTRVLARDVATHRNTVVRVYQDLEAAGFVVSRVGQGTFVADAPPAASGDETPVRHGGALPWASLTSRGARAEPLSRGERLGGARRPDTISLSAMHPSPDLLPDDLFRRCLEHALRTQRGKALAYAPREGIAPLRTLVAEDLARQGIPASADDVVITTGSQQALDLVVRTLVNPDDAVLVNETTYHGALSLLAVAGARIIGVPSDDEGPDLAAIERSGRAGAKLLYRMPNCQNPIGCRISQERREALVAWSHAAGVPLVEDDYASDLDLDGSGSLTPLRALDGEVIYFGTYSKKLIPALRIGYVVCPRALRPAVCQMKQAMDLGTSALLQYALAEFLSRGYLAPHLRAVRTEYRRRRDALEEALRRHLPRGVEWKHPEAGVALWIPAPDALDVGALHAEAQRLGVAVSPSTLYEVGGALRHGLRLTFCAEPVSRLVEGARRLGRAWAAVERRGRSAEPPRHIEVV
ncbi:MAG TPA: PLP-dependent aminotransferase family protein [Anaeromyxobacter sp.]|nr:PLP-dependent aminotransferase family protein [Anaeromyxobacter sp.]